MHVQSKTLKDRFMKYMIEEVRSRHGLGSHAGFETHPEMTPYDDLMLKIIKQIEDDETVKRLAKEKVARKESSMLSYEKGLLPPIIGQGKRSREVVDDEGNVILPSLFSKNTPNSIRGVLFSTPTTNSTTTAAPTNTEEGSTIQDGDDETFSEVGGGSAGNIKPLRGKQMAAKCSSAIIAKIDKTLSDETAAFIALEREKLELARETLKHDKERNESITAVFSIFGNLLKNPAIFASIMAANTTASDETTAAAISTTTNNIANNTNENNKKK